MSNSRDELGRIMARYLDVVQGEQPDAMDQEELRAIALELGVTDEEIAAGEEAAQAHRLRGEQHLAHGLHGDAVREFSAALALRPFDASLERSLAEAHVVRWEAEERHDDAQLARRLALRCVDKDPDDQAAYALLQRLTRPKPRRRRSRLYAVALGLVGASALVLSLRGSDSSTAVRSSGGASTPVGVAQEPSPSITAFKRQLPLTFDDAGRLPGIEFEAVRSTLERFSRGGLSYRLEAYWHNRSERVVDALTVRFDLVLESGETLESKTKTVLAERDPEHRPGDVLQMRHLVHEEGPVPDGSLPARAVLTVTDVVTEAAADYAEPVEVPLSWAVDQGSLKLVARRRSFRVSSAPQSFGSSKGKTFHEAVLEVHNRGPALERLRVAAEWLDGDGEPLGETERYVVSSTDARLRYDQRRLYRLTGMVQGRAEGLRLRIVDVR